MCKPEHANTETMTTEESCTNGTTINTTTPPVNNDDAGLVSIDIGEEKEPASTTKSADGKIKVEEEEEVKKSWKSCLIQFYWANEFLILVMVGICLARAYPKLGAVYLYPAYTASWLAVCFIFLCSGLTLHTEELFQSVGNLSFNAYVLIFNFGVVSSFVFGVSRGLVAAKMLNQNLADGMTICACLAISINSAIILTTAVGGDHAAAVFEGMGFEQDFAGLVFDL